MNKQISIGRFLVLLMAALVLGACNFTSATSLEPINQGTISALAAMTIEAKQTEDARLASPTPAVVPPTETLPPTQTLAPSSTPLPTNTPFSTFTPRPTSTPFPTATNTPAISITPFVSGGSSGSGSGSGPAPTAVLCNRAEFISDVTIPDGTVLIPGTFFTKIWRIRNAGTCTWTKKYDLVQSSGDDLGSKTESIGTTVKPGETVDLQLNLTAPDKRGTYESSWKLRSDDKKVFGVGTLANEPINVVIDVRGEVNDNIVYDFVVNYCSAAWESDAGDLPCPGKEGDEDGFVVVLNNPALENRHENEPALWTSPEVAKDGYIRGEYPPIRIKSGDRFLANIGCLADNPKCDVLFQLKYKIDDKKEVKIDGWEETEDGKITHLDIDLSSLDGKDVSFIFIVDTNGNFRDDAAFWFQPQIKR